MTQLKVIPTTTESACERAGGLIFLKVFKHHIQVRRAYHNGFRHTYGVHNTIWIPISYDRLLCRDMSKIHGRSGNGGSSGGCTGVG